MTEGYGPTNTHLVYNLTNVLAPHRGCSSGVERSLRMRDVLGSIPSISTFFYLSVHFIKKVRLVIR